MHVVAAIAGIIIILIILQDSFETIILPRRIQRRFRLSRLFYIYLWTAYSSIVRKWHRGNRREVFLSYYGPLSLILLLVLWATVLIIAFALLQWGFDSVLHTPDKALSFATYLYMSGTTYFTLGFGDVVPVTWLGRWLAVVESGVGFGFLALIIGYVPIIYQAFSRREVQIATLDGRAGSPPSAAEWLRRQIGAQQSGDELTPLLRDWETWCTEILESHLSYPVLTYYRSQHERQSWLTALTAVLDICALLMVGLDNLAIPSARFTFRIARHAAVDLAQLFGTPPMTIRQNRLPSEDFQRLRQKLAEVGLTFQQEEAEQKLAELRRFYEPFVAALADHLLVDLPPWVPPEKNVDDWMTSAWDHFAEWSPAKIEQVTHLILDHHKKIPTHQRHDHQPNQRHG